MYTYLIIKHKETQTDLVQSLIDLINQYNYTRELTVTLVRNSNEARGYGGKNEACRLSVRGSSELFNQNQKPPIFSSKI